MKTKATEELLKWLRKFSNDIKSGGVGVTRFEIKQVASEGGEFESSGEFKFPAIRDLHIVYFAYEKPKK